ncbi:MAG: 3-deoxy-7-phosphoheptulonate synthase, partial [Clostridiales bacterium]|nr:3-deoxy-7-phosphoheptulonate synthase [Clostridiales bacterium]
MIIVLKPDAKLEQVETLRRQMQERGFIVQDIKGETTHMLGLAGDTSGLVPESFTRLDFVGSVIKVQEPYKLTGRRFHPEDSVIEVMGRKLGGGN